MKRYVLFALLAGLLSIQEAQPQVVTGLLSFDVLIPAGNGSPGIDAFDLFNLTGPAYGPAAGSPYVADSLTLDNVVLTAFFAGGSWQTFDLGNLAPGELVDAGGNPVVQFPGSAEFTSATLSATLSQTTFTLSDGSTFTASPSISVDLTPSSGGLLAAGVDLAAIYAEPAGTATPEPGTLVLLPLGLLAIEALKRR